MAFNDNEDVPQHIYRHWHAMIRAQDLPGLLKLRADDAVLESSAALVIDKSQPAFSSEMMTSAIGRGKFYGQRSSRIS